jgi:hypothetical protein
MYLHNMLYLTCTMFTLSVPDGKPVIGPVSGLSNVYLAAGHEGGGLSMVSFHILLIFYCKAVVNLNRLISD